VDSLSLDPLTGYSQKLIQFFKTVPNWKLEFKTKTNLVDQFLDADHGGNVIVSWSINAHHVVQSEEHKTNSLKERLDAAQKCRDRGFLISFHIDPLIYFEGWQQGYRQLVDEITNRFKPEDLLVLSIGALRFTKDQIAIMRHRFAPDSLVNQAEVFSSDTGKYRYDQRIRQKMFSFVVNAFKDHSPDWNTFLCMETPESWISTYDSMPGRIEPLKDFFRPLPKIKMPTEQQPQY
jgi:spore photoproduct lyase